MKRTITYIFPNWLHPNNIGDTFVSTFIPRLLKKIHPDCILEVVCTGKLYDILVLDESIDICRNPSQDELHLDFVNIAINTNQINNDLKIVYPAWHTNLFSFWKLHHDFLTNHPSANIITVNFLLQLGLQDLLFDDSFNFYPYTNIPKIKNNNSILNLGIVISTKLAGKSTPHPGCNGLGYRYKLEYWKRFVEVIKEYSAKIRIYEFSEQFLNIGDIHMGYTNSYKELITQIDLMDIGVLSDGGLHHVFNCRNIPLVLFQPNILSKVEFVKLSNSYYPEHLHLDCRKSCRSYYSEVFNVQDLSTSCNNECETLDPEELAKYTIKIIEQNL
jgi:hypothetical protein